MGYDEWRVGVEFDGEEFHNAVADQAHDLERRAAVERHGWPVVVARKGDVLRDCHRLAVAVADQLIRRGWTTDPARLEQLQRQMR